MLQSKYVGGVYKLKLTKNTQGCFHSISHSCEETTEKILSSISWAQIHECLHRIIILMVPLSPMLSYQWDVMVWSGAVNRRARPRRSFSQQKELFHCRNSGHFPGGANVSRNGPLIGPFSLSVSIAGEELWTNK